MRVQIILWIVTVCDVFSPSHSILSEGRLGYCTETVRSQKTRTVSYRQSYRERTGWTFRFRTKYRINYKTENYSAVTREKMCCPGYRLNANGYTCAPVCSSGCKHGWCSTPQFCLCHPGYKRNYVNQCIPVCAQDCINGTCVGPNVCDCNDGFQRSEKSSFICERKRKKPCKFGKCTAPDKRTCNYGYQLSSDGFTCEPTCQSTCNNGWCSKPNVCECNPGYIRSKGNNMCLPICQKSCVNGSCVVPDFCACNDGFQKSQDDSSVCNPRCSEPCAFGKCIPKCIHGSCSVGGCACDFGWGGDSCSTPLLCVLAQPLHVNFTNTIRKLSELDSTKDVPKNPRLELERPKCHPECVDQLHSITVSFTHSSEDMIYHFIPIDLPCNSVSLHWAFVNAYSLAIGAVVIIVFF